VKRGRGPLPDCPGVEAFLFSSPSSLRMDSKTIACLTATGRTERCEPSAGNEAVQPTPP
jgi:hypothetical protein